MRPDAGRPSVTFTRPVTRQICMIAAIKDDCSRTIESARNNYAFQTRSDHNPRFDHRWNCSRKNRDEEVVGLKCKRAKREGEGGPEGGLKFPRSEFQWRGIRRKVTPPDFRAATHPLRRISARQGIRREAHPTAR